MEMDMEESYYLDEIFGPPAEIYSSSSNYASNSSSLTGAASQVISFSSGANYAPDDEDISVTILSPNKRVCTGGGRTIPQAREHLLAERKRRENLAQLFVSLSKVVPGLKKLDKASLLEDAANHLKELQERISILEEEVITSNRNSLVNSTIGADDTIDSSSPSNTSIKDSELSIKARFSGSQVLVRIHCKKQTGLMSRVPCQLEKMHLSVDDMRIMPFGVEALDITVLAQMQSEFRGTVKEIVDRLSMLFFTAL